jgi:hypothetical protein
MSREEAIEAGARQAEINLGNAGTAVGIGIGGGAAVGIVKASLTVYRAWRTGLGAYALATESGSVATLAAAAETTAMVAGGADGPSMLPYAFLDTSSMVAYSANKGAGSAELLGFLKGRELITSRTAMTEFANNLGSAGFDEAKRAMSLLSTIRVVPDNASARAMGLTLTKSVGENDRVIFGTADYLGITITTSDAKFLRGAEAQGMKIDSFIHKPVSFSGE